VLTIGSKLRDLRAAKGESLQQVADAVKASKAHVWEVESGKTQNPSIDLVRRLADHFGVTVGWLVGEVPDASLDDQQTLVLYKAVSELPPDDKQLLKSIVDSMKLRRMTSDS
jgi:transcriptional regulator with XRE-family HTH domain